MITLKVSVSRPSKSSRVPDDGAAVYLNGTRVWLHNLPAAVTLSTLALTDVAGTAEGTRHTQTLPAFALLPGTNIIAVEVHQSAMPTVAAPGDLSFDFELSGIPKAAVSPDAIITAGESRACWEIFTVSRGQALSSSR